ncbi:MAG: Spy/CpxP family protein refolding chaperone [Thermoanaerobaculia bacterium]
MFKKTAILAALAIVAASVAVAHPHRGGQFREGGRGAMLMEKLDLTDAQKKEIGELREKQQAAMQSLRDQMQKLAVEFRDLRDRNDPQAEAVREEMRKVREELQARRMAHHADVERLLTPEQKKELDELRAARRDRMRSERRGQGGGPRF